MRHCGNNICLGERMKRQTNILKT